MLPYKRSTSSKNVYERKQKMFYGSHYVLAILPIWATALLCYLIMAVPIQVLRNRYEGMPYQIAWSALFADVGLVVVVLIAATVL